MDLKGKRILIVDDDRDNVELLTEIISKEGHSVKSATDKDDAVHRIKAWKPQLLFINPKAGGVVVGDFIAKVRNLTSDDYTSIVLLNPETSHEQAGEVLELGADDAASKPFRPEDLLLKVRTMLRLKELNDTIRRANHRIDELSQNDDITGLLNLRTFQRKAEEEIQRSRRFRKPVSGLLLNLDDFSAVNESAGLLFGNQVLRSIGSQIRSAIRPMDLVSRIGADEFMILLHETDLAGAELVAEKLREMVQKMEFKADKATSRLTCCIGVAGVNEENPEGGISELFYSVTQALRTAKMNGKNQIEVYSFV